MKVEIDVASASAGRTFLTWAPVKAKARLSDASGASGPVRITLRNGGTPDGGRVTFDTVRNDDEKPELVLDLPVDGRPVDFWVAGKFQRPSLKYGDAGIVAVAGGGVIGRRDLMVRIRKNAVKLTAAERDRFLAALGKLNDQGRGPFQSFRAMHVEAAKQEAHTFAGFPPWHRAYLLDLERELQRIDDQVALPYWRFDEPAPTLFAPEFLGSPPADPRNGDVIQFPAGHALEFWKTDTVEPIKRRPNFDNRGAPPKSKLLEGQVNRWVLGETETLNLGRTYEPFRIGMERAPHGPAHMSFEGAINTHESAAKDPLFFLLHCNVDRLWASWQFANGRTNPASPDAYTVAGPHRRVPNDLGHKLTDTMWPWNHAVGDGTPNNPRPRFAAPRPSFPPSPIVARPGTTPTIRDMIDWQGVHGGEPLGFDYDDVRFAM